jgi:hypothetical protein
MDQEGKFWATCWSILGATLVGLTAVIGGCTTYQTSAVKEMVKGGAEPLAAACAVGTGAESKVCIVLASKVK